jgi:hypothetical protein
MHLREHGCALHAYVLMKSALVDSERYVLACYRYIELNPVSCRHGRHRRRLPLEQLPHQCVGTARSAHPAARVFPETGSRRPRTSRGLSATDRCGPLATEGEALGEHTRQQKPWGRSLSAPHRSADKALGRGQTPRPPSPITREMNLTLFHRPRATAITPRYAICSQHSLRLERQH